MIRSERTFRWLGLLVGLLVGLAWVAPAGANPDTAEKDYLLTPGGAALHPTGARLQIGTGLPLPVQTDGIFTGGTTPGQAGTWPPLLPIVPNSGHLTSTATVGDAANRIRQANTTAMGGALRIPASVLGFAANGHPLHGGVFNTNPAVYDVATTLSYQWPKVPATASGTSTVAVLSPGGGPADDLTPTLGGPGGGQIFYSGGAFGGPAVFALAPGPNAGSRIDTSLGMVNPVKTQATPGGGTMAIPIATVFINAGNQAPTLAGAAAIVAASTAGMQAAAQGASTGAPTYMTAFGPVVMALHPVNTIVGNCQTMGMGCPVGTNGTIRGLPNEQFNLPGGPATAGTSITKWSIGAGTAPFTHNNATTEGFPWTTGFITVTAPGALGPGGELFYLSGNDGRASSATSPGMTGVGNLSLVSGSLSDRNLSGPNANRAWAALNLPEPSAALGAAGALGMLALCHGLVRRRSR